MENDKLLEKQLNWSSQKKKNIKYLSKKLKIKNEKIPNSIQELLNYGEQSKDYEEKLFNLCEKDSKISKLMNKYDITKSDLDNLYTILRGLGGGQLIKKIYLPVAALLTPHILEYIIIKEKQINKMENKNEIKEITHNLISKIILYFNKNL